MTLRMLSTNSHHRRKAHEDSILPKVPNGVPEKASHRARSHDLEWERPLFYDHQAYQPAETRKLQDEPLFPSHTHDGPQHSIKAALETQLLKDAMMSSDGQYHCSRRDSEPLSPDAVQISVRIWPTMNDGSSQRYGSRVLL